MRNEFDQEQEKQPEELNTPENLLEKIKARNDVVFVFLKGGELGGLNPNVKPKIIDRLKKWFEITEGETHQPSFFEICARWSPGLAYQFRKMENNPKFSHDFIGEGRKFISDQNKEGFDEWLTQAEKIDFGDPGLLRQKLMLEYFGKPGQLLLLKLKDDTNRTEILRDLGLADRNSLVKAVGEKKIDLDWTNSSKVDFGNFVKWIVIGNTVAQRAIGGTIRSIIGQELKHGNLKNAITRALSYKYKNPKLWKVNPGDFNDLDDDEETVVSALLNGIHSVDNSFDEYKFMSNSEVDKFSKALKTKK